jgi:hypothetical protein
LVNWPLLSKVLVIGWMISWWWTSFDEKSSHIGTTIVCRRIEKILNKNIWKG